MYKKSQFLILKIKILKVRFIVIGFCCQNAKC